MSNSTITAPMQFLQTQKEKYAYRRFGKKSKYPLLCLQHFTGTLDNWDPALTDGVHLSYDRMSSLLAPYGNPDALRVAHDLDKTVEDLLKQAAA